MSYNGSGTFNINSAGQPVVTGTVISSTAFNALTADLGTGLSTAITKDGQTVATARIPFAAGINSSLVTDSTSTTTGSIITAGGVGIAKALFVGTTLNVAGASTLAAITGTFNGTVGATTPSTGAFTTLSATGTFTHSLSSNAYDTGVQLTNTSAGTSASTALILTNNAGNDAVVRNYGSGFTTSSFQIADSMLLYNNGAGGVVVGGNSLKYYSGTSLVGNFSSTGLAVTGTGTFSGALTIGANQSIGLASAGYLVIGNANVANIYIDSGAGNNIYQRNGGTIITDVSSTGLAVTGTLSATGAITTNGNLTVDKSSPQIIIKAPTGTASELQWANSAGTPHWSAYEVVGGGNSIGDWNIYDHIAASSRFIIAKTTGIVTMSAYGVGSATFSAAGVISSVSDETWKVKDGAPVDTDAMLNKLEPGYWYYNDEKKDTFGKDRQLGFYAQNVNAAIGPEAAPEPETVVTKNDDGTETSVTKPWGYYDRSVLAVTVMSLQKALATIESLTTRITALEAK